jgi:hypothetical protein
MCKIDNDRQQANSKDITLAWRFDCGVANALNKRDCVMD